MDLPKGTTLKVSDYDEGMSDSAEIDNQIRRTDKRGGGKLSESAAAVNVLTLKKSAARVGKVLAIGIDVSRAETACTIIGTGCTEQQVCALFGLAGS